jgi:DUF971 family protein
MPFMRPRAITRRDEGLLVEWAEPGHSWLYPARELRLACPCAACVDEFSGRALLEPLGIPADIRPERVSLVGAYGLRVAWSDGHGTGIYTFEQLLAMCGCPQCTAR